MINIYLIQFLRENHIEGMLGMVTSFPWGYDFFYLPFTAVSCEKIPGGFPQNIPKMFPIRPGIFFYLPIQGVR